MRMFKKYILSFFFFLFLLKGISAKDIQISILAEYNPVQLSLAIISGDYYISLDDEKILKVDKSDHIYLKAIGSKVSVEKNGQFMALVENLQLISTDSLSSFKIELIRANSKTSIYPNSLYVNVKNGAFRLINSVGINQYVAGVIESEIGNVKNLELLKVQAVISRSYVLRNLDKHKAEGFQMCDKVHCQVYHGKCRFNLLINQAVDSTGYITIFDDQNEVIDAVFHANCGGQTINSEDLWSKSKTYLRAVSDTFCSAGKQANWQKEIAKSEWLQYLSRKSGQRIEDPCVFSEWNRRTQLPCCAVSLKDIRTDWKLRSTLFVISERDGKVIFNGKGYGHGVGMCQEGAINMANNGYKYDQIIKFYYTNIHLFPYQFKTE